MHTYAYDAVHVKKTLCHSHPCWGGRVNITGHINFSCCWYSSTQMMILLASTTFWDSVVPVQKVQRRMVTIARRKSLYTADSLDSSKRVWSHTWQSYEWLDLTKVFKNILIFYVNPLQQFTVMCKTTVNVARSVFKFNIVYTKCVITDSYTDVFEVFRCLPIS